MRLTRVLAQTLLRFDALMNSFSRTILALAAAALVAVPGVHATPYEMTGSILVSGSVALNTGSAGTATHLLGWYGDNGSGNARVEGAAGHFLSYAGASASSGSVWNFGATGDPSAFTVAPPLTDFLTIGGMTFYMKDWSIQSQVLNNAFGDKSALGELTISGRGFVSGPDFLTTFGTWIFTTVDAEGLSKATFSFRSDAEGIIPTPVPEGGTTVALLGLGIGALALLQRKLRSAGQKRVAARS
jgi:hypothetical protein